MESLDFSGFKPVTLKDKEMFKDYLAIQNRMSCECNFGNLYAWGVKYELAWIMFMDRLVMYSGLEKEIQMPLGKYFSPEELTQLSRQFADSGHGTGCFYDVPEDYLDKYPELEDFFEIEHSEDFDDYIYSTCSICRLDGRRLRKKRNLIKQFTHENPGFKCIPINPENISATLNLALELNASMPQGRFIEEENHAMQRAFAAFYELDMEGIILHDGQGTLVGFSIFSRLNPETYDIHFEKASRESKGAAQMVTRQTACYLHGKCKYLNREQDLGAEGLRQAKRSLDPVHMYKRYHITRKSA